MEIVYCSRCGNMIPPGGLEEGKHVLVDGEPVCNACAGNLPRMQMERATPTQVPATKHKRPTSKLIAAARRPSSRRLPETVAEAESGPPRWIYGAAGGVGLVLILVLLFALGGGDDPLPAPRPKPQGNSGTNAGKPDPEEVEKPDPPKEDPPEEKLPEKDPAGHVAKLPEGTLRLSPEEDAHYQLNGDKFSGGAKSLTVECSGARRVLLKFDVSDLPPRVERARLRLHLSSRSTKLLGTELGLGVTSHADWNRDGFGPKGKPDCGQALTSWKVAHDRPPEFDVTEQVNSARSEGRRLSLALFVRKPVAASRLKVSFGSKDRANVEERPVLLVTPAGGATEEPSEKPVVPVPQDPPKTDPAPAPVAGERSLTAEADVCFVLGKKAKKSTSKNMNVGPTGGSVSLVRFDLSETRAPVGRAVLKLEYRWSYKNEYAGAVVGLAAVADQSWIEGTVDGRTAPKAGPVRVRWTAAPGAPPRFDVTAIVNEALAAGRKKVSFMLVMEKNRTDGKSLAFSTRHRETAAKRPALVITPKE
ncbi:MAG: DNRLRE domain-containing protein [Planctomycetota bacterium]|jgi:hypothetical protein